MLSRFPVEVLPVVHAGPFEIAVVQMEAEGRTEPRLGSGGDAGSSDVAGVLRDFRAVEDDVEAGHERR